jgi:hypothetical protein
MPGKTITVRVNQDVIGLGAKGDVLPNVERTELLETLLANGIVVEHEETEPAPAEASPEASASAPAG